MVKNVTVKWGPSEHRFGRRFDHGLVSAIWHWRTRKAARLVTADYSAMDNQSWRRFDENLRIKLQDSKQTRVKLEATSAIQKEEEKAEQCAGKELSLIHI